MSILLPQLLCHLYGWRPDFDAMNQGYLLDALQLTARTIASESLPLREHVTFTQPANSLVSPYAGVSTSKECLRIFALRRVDAENPDAANWLREAGHADVMNVQDPSVIPTGIPSSFIPIQGGAILDRRPEADTPLSALVAFSLPMGTDEWPFHPSVESALIDGAIYRICERPGKYQDVRMANEKRRMFGAHLRRIYTESSAGFCMGDPRALLQLPGRPVPFTDLPPESVGGDGGDSGGER